MHSKVFRIIDANLNRAREGLRVVEEVCRFVLEDEKLTLAAKRLRSDLVRVIKLSDYQSGEKLIKSRRALEDVGRELYTKGEGKRTNVEEIFRANMKRVQEAVRCLEEFSKLIGPKYGRMFKSIRFKLYELEKIIILKLSKAIKLDFDLYVITDPQRDHLEVIRKSVASGVKMIQLRDKTIGKQKYYQLAKKATFITQGSGAVLILNDYWDLVKKIGADGVHLGQEDIVHLPIKRVRQAIGEDKIIGISTHSLAQALRAEKEGADYISVGPIFTTPSKQGIHPVGISLLRKVIKRIKIPVVAIGGINQENIEKVVNCGCTRVAVIRAIVAAKKINQAIKVLRKKLSGKA